MSLSGRFRGERWWLTTVLSLLITSAAAAGPMIYAGKFDYAVPEPMYDKMIEFAPVQSWEFFPKLTRFVDTDGDGTPDFIAIALGAEGGFGAQIRYRLNHAENGGEPELGDWYWCVITDGSGEKVFEQFNP